MNTFSIVIPCYNDLALLQKALASVLKQKGIDYDIIITDDSTDNDIEQYIKSLENEDIRYYRHQRGSSIADNWNYGLQKATGKYVILMHHDEEMTHDNYLKQVSQHMLSSTDVVISQVYLILNGHSKRQSLFCRWIKLFVYNHPACLFLVNVIGPCACLTVRREHLQDFNTKLRWLVDVEWYYRMLHGKRFIFDPSLSIHSHHGHQRQITQNINVMEAFRSDKTEISMTYSDNKTIRFMLCLYQHLILGTKHFFRKI